jgi:sterol desaturase/sphingolipid hydroxylase (fatty acid hydroxylase superfamily)
MCTDAMPARAHDSLGGLVRFLPYPLILGGSLVAVTALVDRLGPVWATNLVNVGAGLCIIAAELLLTYRPRWRASRGEMGTDLCYLALSAVAMLVAAAPLMAAVTAAALWLQAQLGASLWPRHWPLWVQLPLALLIYELGSYAFHWLSHHSWLWRLHSIHHGVRRLYGLNAIRSHPIDFVLAVATTSGPLLLLGIDQRLFAQVTVIGTVNMWLQHANADLRTGWLDWVFVTPHIHRWHHSRRLDEQQCNLGAILIVWDIVFGTRLAPADRAPPEDVGPRLESAGTPPYPDGFLAQLAAPFRGSLWPAQPGPPS